MTCFIFVDSRVLVSLPEMILMVADYVCIVFQTDSKRIIIVTLQKLFALIEIKQTQF